MKRFLLIAIICLAATSCRSKKVVSENSNRESDSSSARIERVVDTVYKDRIIEKTKPVFTEIVIEKPCDSLGNLNPIFYNIGSGANRSSVYSKDGKLYLNQVIDSFQTRIEKEYRSRWRQDSLALRNSLISESSSSKEVVRYVYPWWWWLVMILGSLLGLLWIFEKFDLLTRIRKILLKI